MFPLTNWMLKYPAGINAVHCDNVTSFAAMNKRHVRYYSDDVK